MMSVYRIFRLAYACFLSGITFCLLVVGLRAQDGFAVRELNFEGNKSFSSGNLKLLMETKSAGGFSRLFGKKASEFSEDALAADLERIKLFYQREGFLYVKIDSVKKEIDRQGKSIKLIVWIEEGRPIEVRSVTYALSPPGNLSDSVLARIIKRAKNQFLLRPGMRFRDSSIILDQLVLNRALGNVGYPYAEIRSELAVSESDFAVDVTWRIQAGAKCMFGDVRVVGMSIVPADVVIRQVAFKKGDLFRLRLVERTQQQVYGLGTFQVATATPTFSKDRDSVVPVEVFVKDAKRFTTKFGIGYGTEDHFRATSEIRLLGFLGGARRLQLYFKHSYLEPYHITATLVQPAYPTPHTTLTGSPFVWRQREPGFTVNRVGGSLGAIRLFSTKLSDQ